MTENNVVTENTERNSVFIEARDDEELMTALTANTYEKLVDEIAEYRVRIDFGQEATDGMKEEQEKFGIDMYPPVALAIQELGNAQLASDKAWLAKLEEVLAKYFPEESVNKD